MPKYYRVLETRLDEDTAELFRQLCCKSKGKSVHAVLKQYILESIKKEQEAKEAKNHESNSRELRGESASASSNNSGTDQTATIPATIPSPTSTAEAKPRRRIL